MSPYGTSKLMTEMMLADVAAAHDFAYAALRYFNVAGADPHGRTGQSTAGATHLIKVACEVATGKRAEMSLFGTDYDTPDGTAVRDYILSATSLPRMCRRLSICARRMRASPPTSVIRAAIRCVR